MLHVIHAPLHFVLSEQISADIVLLRLELRVPSLALGQGALGDFDEMRHAEHIGVRTGKTARLLEHEPAEQLPRVHEQALIKQHVVDSEGVGLLDLDREFGELRLYVRNALRVLPDLLDVFREFRLVFGRVFAFVRRVALDIGPRVFEGSLLGREQLDDLRDVQRLPSLDHRGELAQRKLGHIAAERKQVRL